MLKMIIIAIILINIGISLMRDFTGLLVNLKLIQVSETFYDKHSLTREYK